MIAGKLVTDTIVPLRTSDTGETALGIMSDFYVRHLPIVNNEQLLGLISEDDILEHDVNEPVGSYELSIRRPQVKYNDHLYEIMRQLSEHQLTVIPVVDVEGNYVGMVTQEDVLNYFARLASFSDPGTILVLEVPSRDYSLAEICRLIEGEDTRVLSAFVSNNSDGTVLNVTLKLNRSYIQRVLATLDRFSYVVIASFNEQELYETLQDNYNSLMYYLDV